MTGRAVEHDRTDRVWGFDVAVLSVDGNRVSLCGWGGRINDGDFLVLPNGDASTRYRVVSIRYMSDPRDQWFADAVFDPRAARDADKETTT